MKPYGSNYNVCVCERERERWDCETLCDLRESYIYSRGKGVGDIECRETIVLIVNKQRGKWHWFGPFGWWVEAKLESNYKIRVLPFCKGKVQSTSSAIFIVWYRKHSFSLSLTSWKLVSPTVCWRTGKGTKMEREFVSQFFLFLAEWKRWSSLGAHRPHVTWS